jgi:phosphoadenosine phosphosulfate reductase
MDVDRMTETLERLPVDQILERLLSVSRNSRACLTCSFQAEDMVVLHLLRKEIPDIPVLFLDTGYHFRATYEYRDRVAKEWSLNLVNVTPRQSVPDQESEFGILYQSDPTRCCQLRKVEPLFHALEPFDIWFTGLRREQSPTRKNLRVAEQHSLATGKKLLKVSLLADWTWTQVWSYVQANDLSHLPQYDEGYLSIGCEPCTRVPDDPANPRSGRWGGKKLECGIHTFSEKAE